MRDEKEERKKQARSNKQTRQSNTAHPRQSLFLEKMSCLSETEIEAEGTQATCMESTCIYMYLSTLDGCQGGPGGVDELGVGGGEAAAGAGYIVRGSLRFDHHLLSMLGHRLREEGGGGRRGREVTTAGSASSTLRYLGTLEGL